MHAEKKTSSSSTSKKTTSSTEKKSSSSGDKAQTHKLSLKGSSKLVTEFFEYSINTILFQRGVYPSEDFTVCVCTAKKKGRI